MLPYWTTFSCQPSSNGGSFGCLIPVSDWRCIFKPLWVSSLRDSTTNGSNSCSRWRDSSGLTVENTKHWFAQVSSKRWINDWIDKRWNMNWPCSPWHYCRGETKPHELQGPGNYIRGPAQEKDNHNDDGDFEVDEALLLKVLNFYDEAYKSGVIKLVCLGLLLLFSKCLHHSAITSLYSTLEWLLLVRVLY